MPGVWPSSDVNHYGELQVRAGFQMGNKRSVGTKYSEDGDTTVHLTMVNGGSFHVRSTNGLRVTPPISMKFGTRADNA